MPVIVLSIVIHNRRRLLAFIAAVLVVMLSGCGQPGYHMVRPGETLYSISWRYALDYQQLAAWNGMKPPYTTQPGQWLRLLPEQKKAAPATASSAAVADKPQQKRVSTAQATAAPSAASVAQRRPAVVAAPAPAPVQSARLQKSPRAATVPVRRQENNWPRKIRWTWPVDGKVIHGFRSRASGIVGQGLDIAGKQGTIVRSAAAGRVVYSGQGIASYGNLLIIKHNDEFLSAYAHNRRLFAREGDTVRAGQKIAEMGNTGAAAQQVKLHFEIRRKGQPVDPARYLPRR